MAIPHYLAPTLGYHTGFVEMTRSDLEQHCIHLWNFEDDQMLNTDLVQSLVEQCERQGRVRIRLLDDGQPVAVYLIEFEQVACGPRQAANSVTCTR